MSENVMGILATIGVLVVLGLFVFGVIFMIQSFREWLDQLRYKYRYKHRFDKPPVAKCFCRDCNLHSNETNRCYKFDGWYTADNWFCWDAKPRDKKFENNKEGETNNGEH